MSDNSGEGGTKIQRRNVQQIPVQQMNGGPDPRMMQQQMGGGQQMSQEEMMMMQQRQQMMMQQQQMQQQQQDPRMIQQQMMQQQMMQEQMMQKQIPKGILKKSSLKNNNSNNFCFSWNNVNVKNSVIVVVIFILLNSRIIWRALSRMPMMGAVEPSILALVVNSLIAGIVFYFVTTKLSK